MAVRRMHSIIAVLMILVISGFLVICHMDTANAYVDPSASEEASKTLQESSDSGTSSTTKKTTNTDTSKTKKAKKKTNDSSSSGGNNSNSGSDNSSGSSDDDVVEENAFSTPGNASLGDVIKSSGSKDFYTIRTDNDNTYYLVIDHEGSMDNVYMLSTIDEADLKDFLEDGDNLSGSIVLPEKDTTEESETAIETPAKEPEKNKLPGIISLVVLIGMAIAGVVMFRRYRSSSEIPEEDYSENMEGDEFPTVNEDEEFLE